MSEKDEYILFLEKRVQIYRKFRARRLTLSIRPDRDLRLTANRTTTRDELLHFLRDHTAWIQKNIAKIENLEKRYVQPKFEDGSLFPFLGAMKYFTFSASRRSRLCFAVEDGFLICYLPEGSARGDFSKNELEKELQRFYKKRGVEYMRQRLPVWTERTGLHPASLKFGRASTRWGSCNSKKQINLNWKLICHGPHLIDYVIVHELCHLRFLNHSSDFWNLVEEFQPEYKVYEKTLNDETMVSRFLSVSKRESSNID